MHFTTAPVGSAADAPQPGDRQVSTASFACGCGPQRSTQPLRYESITQRWKHRDWLRDARRGLRSATAAVGTSPCRVVASPPAKSRYCAVWPVGMSQSHE